MTELTVLTAFLAGLLGSAHCIGMCGGIATALGTAGRRAGSWHLLLYQLGRIASYGAAGALAGALGAAAGVALSISRWSEILRLATAIVIILIGLDISLGTGRRSRWLRAPERWGGRLWRHLMPSAGLHLPDSSPAVRALLAGLLWGWLPCGLVYSVLVAAGLAGGATGGTLIMLAFGLGTLPAMTSLSYVGTRLRRPDGTLARLLGAILVACGLWTAIVPLADLSGWHQHLHHTQHEMRMR